jgi:hypothetical protein
MGAIGRWLASAAALAWFLVCLPYLVLAEIPGDIRRRRRDRLPQNRRAVALAIEAHNARSKAPAVSASIVATNQERCYVLVRPDGRVTDAAGRHIYFFLDPAGTLYAVWYCDGRVVEVVTKRFAWGIRPEPFIHDFEVEMAAAGGQAT